jgi:hypothetical protein
MRRGKDGEHLKILFQGTVEIGGEGNHVSETEDVVWVSGCS